MFTSAFWKDTAERVVSTAAQAGLAIVTADQFDIKNFNLEDGLAVVGLAALASLLKALVASRKSSEVSPASLA